MEKDSYTADYPYMQVVLSFAIVASLMGGIIAQLGLLFIFREADFAQIGYQPLLYVGLLGFIPALLSGLILAYKQILRTQKHSISTAFLVGFIVSALYIAAIVVYLGIHSPIEIAVLCAFMLGMGLFGGCNTAIASILVLPKTCKSYFDKTPKKEHDIYKGFSLLSQDKERPYKTK